MHALLHSRSYSSANLGSLARRMPLHVGTRVRRKVRRAGAFAPGAPPIPHGVIREALGPQEWLVLWDSGTTEVRKSGSLVEVRETQRNATSAPSALSIEVVRQHGTHPSAPGDQAASIGSSTPSGNTVFATIPATVSVEANEAFTPDAVRLATAVRWRMRDTTATLV